MERLEKILVLNSDEIAKIHDNSMKILEKTGIHVNSEIVLKNASELGLSVNRDTKIVRFPRNIVLDCLESLPSKINLYSSNGSLTAELGHGKTYAASGHNAIFVLDWDAAERRNATKEDIGKFALLADYLPNFNIVSPEAFPQDVKASASILHAADALLQNTQKHIFISPGRAEEIKPIYDMVKIAIDNNNLGEKPPITCQLSPTPPLSWEKGQIEALFETVKQGVPLCVLPEPFAGVTSPYTIAGHLTIHNAEVLSGIVFSQLIKKGSSVIYGSGWTSFDMRTINVLIGSPETVLMRLAGSQMADFYHIPYHTIAPDTDAHVMDEQLAWEKFATAWSAYLSQADLIVNGGMLGTGLTVSFEQLVIDNELLSYIKRISRGIKIDDDTLALAAIEKIGPKGNFLSDDHTLKFLGSGEHWEPEISVREQYENWKKNGMKDIIHKAHEKVQSILKTHNSVGLSEQKTNAIKAVIRIFENSCLL
ncbi:MAG: trimethylamine methyltransferase family protein [Spirochaetota bacterium]